MHGIMASKVVCEVFARRNLFCDGLEHEWACQLGDCVRHLPGARIEVQSEATPRTVWTPWIESARQELKTQKWVQRGAEVRECMFVLW